MTRKITQVQARYAKKRPFNFFSVLIGVATGLLGVPEQQLDDG
jgi:hypothetical protein